MTVPILVYTDAPSHPTGLGRICRELVARIHSDEALSAVFRVATLGVYGRGSAAFPWMQYAARDPEDAVMNLEEICTNWFAGDRGVVLTITPPSWLFSLTLPKYMRKEGKAWDQYCAWMETKPFDLWSYLAIESHGPFQQYGPTTTAILRAIDRRLYYSRWGAEIARNTGIDESDGVFRFLGHGIDTERWTPASGEVVRQFRHDLGALPGDLLLGCVATNSRRKLLPLLFESAYLLRHQLGNARLKLWLNTDVAIREYNVSELSAIFGFREGADLILTSTNARRPDDWLAAMYSACDLTVLPTGGEGFGYPVIESLSCGTPCVTGAFGAQAEFLQGFRDAWICPTVATHLITNNTLVEPIYDPNQMANCLLRAWTELRQNGTVLREACRAQAQKGWDWSVLWPIWTKWFLHGAAEMQAAKEKANVEATGVASGPEQAEGAPSVQAEADAAIGVGGDVRGDAGEQGQRPGDGDSGRLDRGAPVGVDREALTAGT